MIGLGFSIPLIAQRIVIGGDAGDLIFNEGLIAETDPAGTVVGRVTFNRTSVRPSLLYLSNSTVEASAPSGTVVGEISVSAADAAPWGLSLNVATLDPYAYVGSDVGLISSRVTSPVYSTTSTNFSIGGNLVRLEKPVASGETYNLVADVQNGPAVGHKTLTLTTAVSAIPDLFARWDTSDAAKLTVASGKLSAWIDHVNGYTIPQATDANRPTVDASVPSSKGYPAVRFTKSASTALRTTLGDLGGINDPLISLINAADSDVTIIVIADGDQTNTTTGAVVSWGNDNAAAAGGVRNYLGVRRNANSNRYSLLRFDTVDGLSSVVTTIGGDTATTAYGFLCGGSTCGYVACDNFRATDVIIDADDGAVTATTFALGNSAVSASSSTGCNDRVRSIEIYSRRLSKWEYEKAVRTAAERLGINIAYVEATRLDLTAYTQTFAEDFDAADWYEPVQANDFGVMSRSFVPSYVTGKTQYGSPGALNDESGYMADFRDPALAAHSPFTVADSCLKISAKARPGSLAGLPLNNGNGAATTWLTGAAITLGRGAGFTQQYGYFETRLKISGDPSGIFGAFWLLAACGRWPTEIDIWEIFGYLMGCTIQPGTHTDAYWPLWSNVDQKVGPPESITTENLHDGFHLLGVDVQPDYMRFYVDRVLVREYRPTNGIIDIAIANGGSGVLASNGTANGTITIKGLAPTDAQNDCKATLTVTAGVVTAAVITNTGCCFDYTPGGSFTNFLRTTGAAIGGGVILNGQVSNDPVLPMSYHSPLYLLINLATGSIAGALSQECSVEFDYVKAWEKNLAAPAILSGQQAETNAIIARMTARGSTPRPAIQTALNNFVRQAKSYTDRKDIMPMGPHTSDWDVSKLTLWQAMGPLYWTRFDDALQSGVCLTDPQAIYDLVAYGAPVFVPRVGYQFSGSAGQYLDSGISLAAHNLIRQYDAHIGVRLAVAAANASLAPAAGAGTGLSISVSATSFDTRVNNTTSPTANLQKLAPGVGHLIACRGWRYQTHIWTDDAELLGAGYFASGAQPTLGNFLIGASTTGTAGAQTTIAAAHAGRRLMPAEIKRAQYLFDELADATA